MSEIKFKFKCPNCKKEVISYVSGYYPRFRLTCPECKEEKFI